MVQERGRQEWAIQKRNASSQPLWFDVDGDETTDASKTGLPVLTFVPAGTAGAQAVYVDEQFNQVLGRYGPNLVENGTFGDVVPSGAFGGGWTSADVDANGGWRSAGGTRFILNSNGSSSSDPTLEQTITGLTAGGRYRISVDVRRAGAQGDGGLANTFGILVDGLFKAGLSGNAAASWTTLTYEFTASAGSHELQLAGERGSDVAFEVDNVRFEAIRVESYVTDFTNTNPLLYVDATGRRTATDTGRPSLVPVNEVALGNFTRVYDKVVPGGGTDVLNVRSSGSGVGPLAVLMDTYRVPVAQLAGGVPVLQATGDDLAGYHLNPVQRFFFGGEPVLDPFTGAPMTYAGGEDVVDLFTGRPVKDPFGQILKHQAGDPMLHVAGDPVYHVRGTEQRWLGGEAVLDEQGNPVYNNATTPFLHASGQVIVESRRQAVYVPSAPAYFTYSGSPLTLTAAPGANDRVIVTVFAGTRIENLAAGQFSVSGTTLTITKAFPGPVRVAVTISTPAVHALGDPKYYFGDEPIVAGQPITDSQGNLTFDSQGEVALYVAADETQARRELLSLGTGTVNLLTAPNTGTLKVTLAGKALTLGTHYTVSGATITVTAAGIAFAAASAGSRLVADYAGARLHRRGEPVYTQDATGFWIAETYAGGEPVLTLGSEAKLYVGGERVDYYASDPRLQAHDEQRITAIGAGGMPGSIHYFGLDEVNLYLGAGDDKVTIATTHTGTTTVDTGAGNDRIAVRTVSGATTVLAQAGTDAISVGSNAGFWPDGFVSVNGTVDGIAAKLTVDGGAGGDALRLDDTGDTNANNGTLTVDTIRGLDMPAGVDYTAFEALNIDLGAGDDTFTIESTHASGDFERFTTVEGRGGADRLYVRTISGPTTVRGDGSETIGTHVVSSGTGADVVKVGSLQPAAGGTINTIVGLLTFEGGGGSDVLAVDDTGDAT
jgi:hypothetical protein